MEKTYKLIIIFLLFVIFNPVLAQNIELITTIPVETSLGDFGTRQTGQAWVEVIENAKHSIDIAQFYLANKKGELFMPVIQAVLNAAKRGVNIRILVGKPINKDMKENTGDVLDLFKNNSNIKITLFNWKKLNGSIIHAKYFIIDKEIIFVGSQNFDWRALKHIHETGLLINNKDMAAALTSVFVVDWKYSNGDTEIYNKMKNYPPVNMPKNTFFVASPAEYNPPGIKNALNKLVELIKGAKNKINIQLLNYKEKIYRKKKSFLTLTNALKHAAEHNVNIRILVSNWYSKNSGVKTLLNLNKTKNIEVRIVTIPPSKTGYIPYARVIHSKVMRVDNISWIGNSNWGWDYFFKSRNIEVITKNHKIANTLDKLFEQLWNSSYSELLYPGKKYIPAKR